MKRSKCLCVVLCLLGAFALAAGQQATVQEEKQVIKTYPYSGGDPTPIMTRSSMWGRGQALYPYHFIDEISADGKAQTWNVVRLENPYVQVFVLPAEGGKLIGAVEKAPATTLSIITTSGNTVRSACAALGPPEGSSSISVSEAIRQPLPLRSIT